MATRTLTHTISIEVEAPPDNLPETDGIPMENDWHRLAMSLLIESITYHWRDREDYFVGGNMCIYFNENQWRNRDFLGPDFFFVSESTLNPPRRYWAIWDEGGKYPDVIIELMSASTEAVDKGSKKETYEKTFRTYEYFVFNPDTNVLEGWRRKTNKYEPITPNDRGWLWSEQLGMWLGVWTGRFQNKHATYVRFYDAEDRLVPSLEEVAQAAQAEVARLKEQLAKQGNNSQ